MTSLGALMTTTKWLLTPPHGTAIRQQIIQAGAAQAGQYSAANAIIIEFAEERKTEMLEWMRLEVLKFEHGTEATPEASHYRAVAEQLLKNAQHPSIPPEVAVMNQPAPPIKDLPPEVRLAAQAQAMPSARIPAAPPVPSTQPEPSAPAAPVIRVVPDVEPASEPTTIAERAIAASTFNPLTDPCPACGGQLKLTWAAGMVAIKCGTQGCLGVTPP
jgi:hypothetical protein